ncbi:MAG: hypothetical protein V4725_12520 [Bacteroidota bacterium]
MKKATLFFPFLLMSFVIFAQDPEEDETINRGFKKENLFTGGNVIASFYSGGTTLGVSPHFGYSVTNWLDVAASLNFIYTGQRDEFETKYRQTNIGPGAFIRVFPLPFLFVQGQYERNFQTLKVIPFNGTQYKIKENVNSVLMGAGFASGREKGNNTYYYFAVMLDVLKKPNSPYVDSRGQIIPVIRAGFNIALFQSNRNRSF